MDTWTKEQIEVSYARTQDQLQRFDVRYLGHEAVRKYEDKHILQPRRSETSAADEPHGVGARQ
jgi:hypothetical protein